MTSLTLADFAREAKERVARGYYDTRSMPDFCPPKGPPSLRAAIARSTSSRFALIAEVKPASPTQGEMRRDVDAGALARSFVAAGASAVSALAVDSHFGGSLQNVIDCGTSGAPVLFKDFVVDEQQLKAARRAGASAVLLIDGISPPALIARAHDFSLEVLYEAYDAEGFTRALATRADLIGINNRDLRRDGLPISLATTENVLAVRTKDRPVVSLSGIRSAKDVERVRRAGASAALVGSALMRAADPGAKLKELMASSE
ncbi:MAG: indole-3-glycerol-phosphate synthase [Thermoplasmatota archaeon]